MELFQLPPVFWTLLGPHLLHNEVSLLMCTGDRRVRASIANGTRDLNCVWSKDAFLNLPSVYRILYSFKGLHALAISSKESIQRTLPSMDFEILPTSLTSLRLSFRGSANLMTSKNAPKALLNNLEHLIIVDSSQPARLKPVIVDSLIRVKTLDLDAPACTLSVKDLSSLPPTLEALQFTGPVVLARQQQVGAEIVLSSSSLRSIQLATISPGIKLNCDKLPPTLTRLAVAKGYMNVPLSNSWKSAFPRLVYLQTPLNITHDMSALSTMPLSLTWLSMDIAKFERNATDVEVLAMRQSSIRTLDHMELDMRLLTHFQHAHTARSVITTHDELPLPPRLVKLNLMVYLHITWMGPEKFPPTLEHLTLEGYMRIDQPFPSSLRFLKLMDMPISSEIIGLLPIGLLSLKGHIQDSATYNEIALRLPNLRDLRDTSQEPKQDVVAQPPRLEKFRAQWDDGTELQVNSWNFANAPHLTSLDLKMIILPSLTRKLPPTLITMSLSLSGALTREDILSWLFKPRSVFLSSPRFCLPTDCPIPNSITSLRVNYWQGRPDDWSINLLPPHLHDLQMRSLEDQYYQKHFGSYVSN